MSKDRARPFSRKHRRIWIPVTGGMLLIGVLNLGLGFCSYEPPGGPPQRIILKLPPPSVPARAAGTIGLGEVPTAVMTAFVVSYPRNVPTLARKLATPADPVLYELTFGAGPAARRVTFRADGTQVDAPVDAQVDTQISAP